jgi:hypothetical protein
MLARGRGQGGLLSRAAKRADADMRGRLPASDARADTGVATLTRHDGSLSRESIYQAILTKFGRLSRPNHAKCVALKHAAWDSPGKAKPSIDFLLQVRQKVTILSFDPVGAYCIIRSASALLMSVRRGSTLLARRGVVAPIGHLSSYRSTAMFASLARQTASSMRCPPSRLRVFWGGAVPHAAWAG